MKKLSGTSHQFFMNTWKEGTQRTEPGFIQWLPVTRSKMMGTNWNTGSYPWTSWNSNRLHDREHWHRLSKEVAESFLKKFGSHLNMALGNWLLVVLPQQGFWTRGFPEIPSNHAMISWTSTKKEARRKKEAWQFIIFRINCTLYFIQLSNLNHLTKCWAVSSMKNSLEDGSICLDWQNSEYYYWINSLIKMGEITFDNYFQQ